MIKKILSFILVCACLLTAPVVFAQKQGGTASMPMLVTNFIRNFNPFTQDANKGPARGFIYETLLVYNFRQNRIDYRLAESFEYSKDLKSITYTLREGLKWSDGKPLTADDAVFSFNLAKNNTSLDMGGLFVGDTPKLTKVEKVDDRSFRVHLGKLDSTIEWYIPEQYIVPKHIWGSVKDPTTFKNDPPVGSGPLTTIKRVVPQQMVICRNPNYWEKGKPYIDCLRMRQYQSNDQVQAALMRGEIDMGANFIADIESTYVAKDPKNNHFWYPAKDSIAVYLNHTKKPFDNLKFRQAFSMALDRAAIVDLATYGYASPNPHITGIGDFFQAYYDDSVNQKYDYLNEYNPDAARKLLDEAGFKDSDGDGVREMDGEPIEFQIMVVNGWTDWVQSVQMVTEYLQEIGIAAKMRTVEWGQYAGGWKDRNFEAGILWGGIGMTPYRVFEPMLRSGNPGQWLSAHGWTSPKADKLLDEYAATIDEKKQRKIISQLQELFAQNLPIIPLFSNPVWYQYCTKRFLGWPTKKNPYINPNFTDAGERVILINNIYQK